MSDQVYVAPLYIAVAAPGEGEACDTFSESLRTLMHEGVILDWGYAEIDGAYASPIPVDLTVEQAQDEETNKQYAYEKARPLNPPKPYQIVGPIVESGFTLSPELLRGEIMFAAEKAATLAAQGQRDDAGEWIKRLAMLTGTGHVLATAPTITPTTYLYTEAARNAQAVYRTVMG